ncbi:MAG TPA: hypothetical protein VK855_08640 [Thioalkalivibrio sp.]|nr:hypothetical protein [Thioalkalivibrio sp.]
MSVERTELQTLLDAGKTGAMVGTAGAAAMNLHRMQREGISWQAALRSTAQAGLYAGIATAAATAVGRMTGHNPILTAVATLTTGAAVMYALTTRTKERGDA